jgi:hypothetical protein
MQRQGKVIKLLDANKAKAAFLAPLLTACGSALASWAVTGNFNASEIRTAASGAILAAVAGLVTYVTKSDQALVEINR